MSGGWSRDLSAVPVVQPRHLLGAFSLYGPEHGRADARRRDVDALLAGLGIRPRRRSGGLSHSPGLASRAASAVDPAASIRSPTVIRRAGHVIRVR